MAKLIVIIEKSCTTDEKYPGEQMYKGLKQCTDEELQDFALRHNIDTECSDRIEVIGDIMFKFYGVRPIE